MIKKSIQVKKSIYDKKNKLMEFQRKKVLLGISLAVVVIGGTLNYLTDNLLVYQVREIFLGFSQNINSTDAKGNTQLHNAIQDNESEVIDILISNGAQVNAKNNNDNTPLHYAGKSQEITALLINKGADVNAKNNQGITPLHNSRRRGVAEILITHGADINAQDKKGKTPLHYLVTNDSQSAAELLINQRANINAKDNNNQTPLDYVRSQEMAKLMISSGAKFGDSDISANSGKYSLLHEAVALGNKNLIELLIANGVDINIQDEDGNTALHYGKDNQEITQLLIANGANVNAKNKEGNTSLHQTENLKVAQLLITNGADINAQNKWGFTPIFTTSKSVAKLLFTQGENLKLTKVNAKDYDGSTPLHYAKLTKLIVILIEDGADVNARDNYGETPLHYARDNQDVAAILIANGADVNAKNNYGETPLHKVDNQKVAALLISHGADVNAKNNYGETPLNSIDNQAVVEFIKSKMGDKSN
ncbi:hypothetical protein AFK68_11665 [Hydrocoleum sp. CS-953]|uniref:ankyrin repeat domain-containing protein n=1 Tax=Hydrocoleum sp. CS-953 TaxID=1671698 RepID=UPI000B9C0F10|nr:ankyrin repeat domain-containing protein [Hydrocoleum sp. CS-953]OZH54327.1 hypothetical protein AFK68_11665 [Hydrocoleum sp. CS-953]